MRKTLMLILVLLVSALWVQAQDATQAPTASGPTTIQGCLTYAKGHYWLTEDNGTAHQLQSQANKLQKHVGHEVAITGKPAIRSVGTTIQGQGSSVKEEPVFKVSDVQHVADACTSAGH
ncbi:MAG: hypothetical protein WAN69_16720 [Candidatus Korobacteraceae bacterium]|jgi:hypothetical protein